MSIHMARTTKESSITSTEWHTPPPESKRCKPEEKGRLLQVTSCALGPRKWKASVCRVWREPLLHKQPRLRGERKTKPSPLILSAPYVIIRFSENQHYAPLVVAWVWHLAMCRHPSFHFRSSLIGLFLRWADLPGLL